MPSTHRSKYVEDYSSRKCHGGHTPSKKCKKHSKPANCDQEITITVDCSGDNAQNCQGLGVFDGNFNRGSGSGNTGSTGGTGGTGATGYAGADQVYLQQYITPTSFSEVGIEFTLTFIVTNISGVDIAQPLVITSSRVGTFFLTDRGLQAGETITVVREGVTDGGDVAVGVVSSLAFVAIGVPTGTPGHYDSGARISATALVTAPIIITPGATDL